VKEKAVSSIASGAAQLMSDENILLVGPINRTKRLVAQLPLLLSFILHFLD
jgi:hypothetical protein